MDIMHCSTPVFAASSRKVSKIHSITERKKLEKIASVSLAKHDPDPLIFIYLFIFFVLSLKLRNSKDLLILKLLGVERLWCFRVLFANTLFFDTFWRLGNSFLVSEIYVYDTSTITIYYRKLTWFSLMVD